MEADEIIAIVTKCSVVNTKTKLKEDEPEVWHIRPGSKVNGVRYSVVIVACNLNDADNAWLQEEVIVRLRPGGQIFYGLEK